MAYTNYETLKEITSEFHIKIKRENFLQESSFNIEDYLKKILIRNIKDVATSASEASICENIIAPIIKEIAYYNNLTVWSHVPFSLEGSESLKGIPDYLIGIVDDDASSIRNPVLCLGEAKKEDFSKGWAQVSAEMYAAYQTNKNSNKTVPVYGLVTTGKQWEFAILEDNKITIDINTYSLPSEMQKIFNILNWIFSECRKNIDTILKIENEKL